MEEQEKINEQNPNPEEAPKETPPEQTPEELNATIERFKVTLAERDAEIAQLKGTMAEMHDAAAAQHAEAEKLGQVAEEAALAGKKVAEENDKLRSRIAELEAAQKDAETLAAKIAAEKYGAAVVVKQEDKGFNLDALKAEYDAVKADPIKRGAFVRELSAGEFKALFK